MLGRAVVGILICWQAVATVSSAQTCVKSGSVPARDQGGPWVVLAQEHAACTPENGGYIKKQDIGPSGLQSPFRCDSPWWLPNENLVLLRVATFLYMRTGALLRPESWYILCLQEWHTDCAHCRGWSSATLRYRDPKWYFLKRLVLEADDGGNVHVHIQNTDERYALPA